MLRLLTLEAFQTLRGLISTPFVMLTQEAPYNPTLEEFGTLVFFH
jgi:hypothetical protein